VGGVDYPWYPSSHTLKDEYEPSFPHMKYHHNPNFIVLEAPRLKLGTRTDDEPANVTPVGMFEIEDCNGIPVSDIVLDMAWFKSCQQKFLSSFFLLT
jgi:hypothetical protein